MRYFDRTWLSSIAIEFFEMASYANIFIILENALNEMAFGN